MAANVCKPLAATWELLDFVCFMAFYRTFYRKLFISCFSYPCFVLRLTPPPSCPQVPFSSLISIQIFFSHTHHHGRVLRNSCFCLIHWAVHCFPLTVQDQPRLSASTTRSSFLIPVAPVSGTLLLKAAWPEVCCLRTAGSGGRKADGPLRCVLYIQTDRQRKNTKRCGGMQIN